MTTRSAAAPAAFEYFLPPRPSVPRRLGRIARDNPIGVLSLLVLLVLIVMAVFADQLAPHGKYEVAVGTRLEAPNSHTYLGTDQLGRDILSRMMHGARISLRVGFIAVGLGTLAGSIIGMVSGYAGGWIDLLLQRLMDIVMSIPALLLAMIVVAALGAGASNAMYAIAIVLTPGAARVVRSVTLGLKGRQFIEAAQASGASGRWILIRHIIPNARDEIIVLASVALAGAIIAESALAFIGLGTQPPEPSWGTMLADGRQHYERGPHMVYVPAGAISLTVLAVTMLGDTVRDVLDPKVRGGGKVQLN
jgi:peptide/nickel transport system permease protein